MNNFIADKRLAEAEATLEEAGTMMEQAAAIVEESKRKHRKSATGQDCDYRRQPPQGPIDDEVVAMVSAAIRSPSFVEKMRDEMDTRTDEETIRTELAALRMARTQYAGAKDKLADRMDSLDVLDPAYDAKYADMERRLDALYLKISETEDDILLAEHDLARANDARVSLQAAYELLEWRADDLPSMPDAMKKECIASFVESVDIYPEKQPDGRWIRNVRFRFPVMLDGEHEGREWSRDDGHVESLVLLTQAPKNRFGRPQSSTASKHTPRTRMTKGNSQGKKAFKLKKRK